MDSSNAELRERISLLCTWTDLIFKKLAALSHGKLEYGRWLKLVAEYYIDVLNGDGSDITRQEATQTLLLRAAKKSSRSYSEVWSIFQACKNVRSRPINLRDMQAIQAKYPDVHSDHITALMLRYHLLLKSGGHFLSIDRELYQQLYRSSRLPVLECYASPFNHNLTHYCSLFDEDVHFGACPRFDKLIDTINFPCRLIANPPYTIRAIRTCVAKILKYMGHHNGEFIALLPYLENSAFIRDLLESKNTAHVLMRGDSYLLHDFVAQTDLVAPILLYIVVNVEGSYIKSCEMANSIAYDMRRRAFEYIRGNE